MLRLDHITIAADHLSDWASPIAEAALWRQYSLWRRAIR